MTEKFDAIVIGAGPAGSAAAYSMAKAGLSVLVLERGEFPGAKNASGAVFYTDALKSVLGDFWQEAPVERWINHQVVAFLKEDSSVEIKFSRQPGQSPIGVSVLRSRFDRWLAGKAASAGAMLLSATLVDDLLFKDKAVVGVRAAKEQGEVYAGVVVIADGANSLMAEKADLRGEYRLRHLGLGFKEVIKLPARDIEQRFLLSGDEGAAYTFVGEVTKGLPGGGFLYTNKESISVGIVVNLGCLKDAKVSPAELLDRFKEHRAIAPLLSGGTMKEYSAHLIPEGGYDMLPRLYADGVLVVGDAAGLTLNRGWVLRGMDLAVASGTAAAETVIRARGMGDFSARSLSYYQQLLERGFILRDLKKFRQLSRFLQNERLYREYPEWLCQVAESLFRVEASPGDSALKLLLRTKPRNLSLLDGTRDVWKGIRNL